MRFLLGGASQMSDDKPIASDKTDGTRETVGSVPLLYEPTRDRLDEREQVDYAALRRSWIRWCLSVGKDPQHGDGYAQSTVRVRANVVDGFFRWVWDERGYTTQITHEDGDEYLRHLAFNDYSQEHKLNALKSLQMYFSWLNHEKGEPPWEPEMSFSQPARRDATGDAFDQTEQRQIREAALEYGSIPHYSAVDPDERATWKRYLAQRYEKPMDEVGLSDWERANDWKYPSLVWTSLDAALRPTEVAKAKTSWLELDRQRLVIPKADDVKTKQRDQRRRWTVALTERTTESLRRWIDQRACYEKYADTDALWLTRFGNPYGSSSLKKLVGSLCEIAGIDTRNRSVSWYSIRRGIVTEMVEESDLSTTAEQVRHVDIRSTARYDQVSDDRRRNVLERMG